MKMRPFLKLIMAACSLLSGFTASAYDFMENGICYNINSDGQSVTVTYERVPDYGNGFISYSNLSGELLIPESVCFNGKTYMVASIYNEAFRGCSNLTSLTIPSMVSSIGDLAFSSCIGLNSITWNAKNCSDFYKDTYGSFTNYYSPFQGLPSVKSFIFGNAVERIPSYLCYGLTGLTAVTIPSSVTSIGDKAFCLCSGLGTIHVASGNNNYDSRNNCNAIIETASNTLIFGCKNTTIPNSVVSIGKFAFYGQSGLTTVTIPSSITSIDSHAFYNCNYLTSVIWNAKSCEGFLGTEIWSGEEPFLTGETPFFDRETQFGKNITSFVFGNGVERIPAGICCGLSNLTSLTIPESVTSIGDGAFRECSALTGLLIIPNSVTYIGDYAFENCGFTGDLTISNSVKTIGYGAFRGCSGLSGLLTIGNAVTSIDEDAFSGCSGLTTVTWNAKHCNDFRKSYGEYNIHNYSPFQNLAGVNSFIFGNVVERVPANICYGLSGLTSLTIPISVLSIGDGAFCGCSNLSAVAWNAKRCEDFSFNNAPFRKLNNIKSFVFGDAIERIPAYVCSGLYNLTSLIIPNSVTTIGEGAFCGCRGLTGSLIIPGSVTSIDEDAFSDCSGFDNISVELNNAYYDSRNNCNAIIETANDKLLLGCKNTKIPNTVTAIGNYAFYGCSGLSSIIVPNSVSIIGEESFAYCGGLTSVAIGNSIATIGSDAFQMCKKLNRVDINDLSAWFKIDFALGANPLSYAHNLYLNSEQIKNLVVPSEIHEIKNYVLDGCEGLASVTIHNSVSSIGINAFNDCIGLTSLILPNSVKTIGDGAFYHCTGLSSLNIPNSVTAIGEEAFAYCSNLTTLTIPSSVTTINNFAFSNCNRLTTINNHVDHPTNVKLGSGVFSSTSKENGTLYVNKGRVDEYQKASQWKEFKNIQVGDWDHVPATGISLNCYHLRLRPGETYTLTATVTPDNAENKGVIWKSSDTMVATVSNNGVIIAKSKGLATITATTSDSANLSASCNVTVGGAGKTGDINGDGIVDVGDVAIMINVVLGIDDPRANIEDCDLNGDGQVDVTDVNDIIDIILGKK